MAFSLDDIGGIKANQWNTFEAANANRLNSYAHVTAISTTSITIDTANAILGAYEQFAAGSQILFHVSASKAGATQYLGKWCHAQITAVSGDLLTLNKDVTQILPAANFNDYYVQAITFACLKNMTLPEGVTIAPPAYSASIFCGGIVVIKHYGTLQFSGGHIDLTDKGIPTDSKTLRPWLKQELQGKLDTDKYSGWENGITADRFLLNAGDGACFIVTSYASPVTADGSATLRTSRIGNVNSKGVLNCRGAADSANKPANVTNIGGSTILLIHQGRRRICQYFGLQLFSKYRSTALTEGQGLGRAYVAYGMLPYDFDDEGCAAIDLIDNPALPATSFNIHDFGDGSLGNVTNPTVCINNYARITAVSADRKQLTYDYKTTNGLAPIAANSPVMIVGTSTSTDTTTCRDEHGKMIVAHVLSVTATKITLDTPVPEIDSTTALQLVSIPQFNNFTLNQRYYETPPYWGHASESNIFGYGGICALACKGTCNLSGGQLDVTALGMPCITGTKNAYHGDTSYAAGRINYGEKLSNANMSIRFPPGGGHGAVFILANVLTMNENTRIGATYTGNFLGGIGIAEGIQIDGGGWKGADSFTGDNFGGSGSSGGRSTAGYGGHFAASSSDNNPFASHIRPKMGANILIIADTINNFNLAAISTGGAGYVAGRTSYNGTPLCEKSNGGCGYGGGGGYGSAYQASSTGVGSDTNYDGAGGGYHGGGAGSFAEHTTARSRGVDDPANAGGCAGNAFIFCNNAVNQNTSGIVVEE